MQLTIKDNLFYYRTDHVGQENVSLGIMHFGICFFYGFPHTHLHVSNI